MIKFFTQGLATDAELFGLVGAWAVSSEVHEQLGVAVTGMDGDVWLVSVKNSKPIGFAQIRPMKNEAAHLRYLFSDSLSAKLELGHAAAKKVKELGFAAIYTNERRDSVIMPQLDFVKTTDSGKTRFCRWERSVA